VDEPVKMQKPSTGQNVLIPNDSSISGLQMQNQVSSTSAVVPSISTALLLNTNFGAVPAISPSAANMTAITAQILAQQVLAKSGLATGPISAPKLENRIYVGSLHYSLRETDITALFSAFGPVVKCDMSFDQALGRSKGFCFVEFQDPQTAQAAMTMDGFELAGRKIKVGRPSHMQMNSSVPQIGAVTTAAMQQFPSSHQIAANSAVQQMSATFSSANIISTPPVSTETPFVLIRFKSFDYGKISLLLLNLISLCFVDRNIRTSIGLAEIQELFSLHGSIKSVKQLRSAQLDPILYYDVLLEFQEGGSVASQAAATMNGYTLSKSQLIVEAISLPRAVQLMVQNVESATAQTAKTVVLEDMVTVEDMKDPDLKDEIAEEAGNYGTLDSIDISLSSSGKQAIVKLVYAEANQAARACKALHGRCFAGRKIRATIFNQP
jgi:hypothetical protein